MLGATARPAIRAAAPRAFQRQALSRRYLGTTPPAHRSRTFKNSLARWGLAAGGIWYYSTHDVWAETGFSNANILDTADEPATAELPTIESIAESRKQRLAALPATPTLDAPSPSTPSPADSQAAAAASLSSAYPPSSSSSSTQTSPPVAGNAPAGGVEDLEEEAEGEGAFNPETGEINWDCPCLGGMAHGPCGAQFRDAFSCFVYSQDEPKGINCIDKFKNMQDCFRAHPDVYGDELTGEDGPMDDDLKEPSAAPAHTQSTTASSPAPPHTSTDQPPAPPATSRAQPPAAPYSGAPTPADSAPGANLTSTPSATPSRLSGSTGISENASSKDDEQRRQVRSEQTEKSKQASAQMRQVGALDESEELVPKAWHDTTEMNKGK